MVYEVQIQSTHGNDWGTLKKKFKTKAKARAYLLNFKQEQRWGLKRGLDLGALRVKYKKKRRKR